MVIHYQGSPKRPLKFYLKNKWGYKADLMHATSYLLKLQIDHVILDLHSQAYMKHMYAYIKSLKLVELQIYTYIQNDTENIEKYSTAKICLFQLQVPTFYAYIAGVPSVAICFFA